ncbi:MAG: hypothetical protein JSV97_00110 [candidate division WOR-3 bacterium]|nr:MAG: hypothetical protein JSV97_00110 [candidate division WOR-3 bacterium]
MSDYLDKWKQFLEEEDVRDTYGDEVVDRNEKSREEGSEKMGLEEKSSKSAKRKRRKKRAKKKAKKGDRCTRIAKRKYDVWPSAYASGAVVRCRRGEIWKGLKEEEEVVEEDSLDEKKKKRKKRKKKKAGTESSKESSLRDWFGRKGAPGKKGGWVDCNTCRKDKKTGRKKCKPCGRQKGEKRAKYPSCRPTPGACGERGRGRSWGKKSAKNEGLRKIALQELQNNLFKPGLRHHVDNGIPVTENIYRIGSPCYFNVNQQARHFYNKGIYEALNDEERDLLENTDLGEWGMYEGERVPLDFPMYEETLEEAEYRGKKVQLGKPTTGDVKKYKVYVRNKAGNVIKVNYGDSKGGLKGNWNNAEARASFAARHNCADKKDRTKAGYWACRAHKDFGKNVPGRFW